MRFEVGKVDYGNGLYFLLIKGVLFRDGLIGIKKSRLFHEEKGF